MRVSRSGRTSGAALVTAMALVAFIIMVSAALSALSASSLRSATRSDSWMRAFYLADSGAQIGNAMVRASGPSMPPTSFVEDIGGEVATVDVQPQSAGIYEIRSSATVQDQQLTVEILVEFIAASLLDGSFQVNISNGVEVQGDTVPVTLKGTVVVSGMNHSSDGALLADQTGAVNGMALNPVPGATEIDVEIDVASTPNVTLEGDPDALTNGAGNISGTLDTLLATAQTGADVFLSGPTVLDDAATGTLGTAAAPKLTYVSLGDNESLSLIGNFSGHGTLVVDVGRVDDVKVLDFVGSTSWHGLVYVHFRDVVNMQNRALVNMVGTSRIVGGLVTSFTGPSVNFGSKGQMLRVNGTVDLLYSSELVAASPAVPSVVEQSAKVASYKVE